MHTAIRYLMNLRNKRTNIGPPILSLCYERHLDTIRTIQLKISRWSSISSLIFFFLNIYILLNTLYSIYYPQCIAKFFPPVCYTFVLSDLLLASRFGGLFLFCGSAAGVVETFRLTSSALLKVIPFIGNRIRSFWVPCSILLYNPRGLCTARNFRQRIKIFGDPSHHISDFCLMNIHFIN